ncbi:MAG: hypothetical protein WC584_01185 [Candidatus Pacearchaeota archaeon]
MEENQNKMDVPTECLYDYLLRDVYGSALVKDKNYSKYLENISKVEELKGIYVAYQNEKIVYVGSPKIKNDFGLAIEKMLKLIPDDPVLIMKVGEGFGRYLLKKDFWGKSPKVFC